MIAQLKPLIDKLPSHDPADCVNGVKFSCTGCIAFELKDLVRFVEADPAAAILAILKQTMPTGAVPADLVGRVSVDADALREALWKLLADGRIVKLANGRLGVPQETPSTTAGDRRWANILRKLNEQQPKYVAIPNNAVDHSNAPNYCSSFTIDTKDLVGGLENVSQASQKMGYDLGQAFADTDWGSFFSESKS